MMKTWKAPVKKFFQERCSLGDFLFKLCPLKPAELGDVAKKGGVWIQRSGKGKILRIRELNSLVSPEDLITLNFDPKILKLPELTQVKCLYEDTHYGVYIKPPGAVPQGSEAGDHTSLLRYVEKLKKKEAYLIHRLDRETAGVMLIGYTGEAAAKLSQLFVDNKVTKTYEAIVKGSLPVGEKRTISDSLDDKSAVTHFKVIASNSSQSLLEISIETGRLHQIRRHLSIIGFPVMGDPKYGVGNKNRDGLKLNAFSLRFTDPWSRKEVMFELSEHLSLKSNPP